MLEANKTLARKYIETGFNGRNLDVADAVFSPDHGHGTDTSGPEGVKERSRLLLTAFPDGQQTIDEIVAEGDTVVVRWTLRGTHAGELRGIAPTGTKVELRAVVIQTIRDGKIVSTDGIVDWFGLLNQLGAMPPLLVTGTAGSKRT